MSLASPLWLVVLALIPLALFAQSRMRRRSRTYAVRFTAVESIQLAAASSSRWLGRLPMILLLAAFGAGGIALARPRVTQRVPIQSASLMLVLDHSGSMIATDVKPTRLGAAVDAANTFIDEVPSTIKLGAIGFSSQPDAVQRPVVDHGAARALIDSQQAGGGTATGPALQLALQVLHADARHHQPSAIVLLSDGSANIGVNPVTVARLAHRDHVPIYTVALGTAGATITVSPFQPPVAVPPDPELMAAIARTSGGHSFDAQSSDDLQSIYQSLGRQLTTVSRKHDITAFFAIAAALLLIAALAGSVRLGARLP
jgi:Ca-activated chloride channel homolog